MIRILVLILLLPLAVAAQTPRVDSLRAALAATDDSLSKLHDRELYSKQALAYMQTQLQSEKKDYFIYGITTLFLLTLATGVTLFEVRRHRQTLRTRARELETQQRHQQAIEQTREEERKRILADLHDELGSGLSSIRIMSDILAAQGSRHPPGHDQPNPSEPGTQPGQPNGHPPAHDQPNPSEPGQSNGHSHEDDMITRYARKISDISRDTAQGMNTIIWALNNDHDSLNDLCEYIGRFGHGLFENTATAFHLVIASGLPDLQLSGAHRKNLFLCVKESLHNVLKHSGARNAWVDITIYGSHLLVTITDDGRGLPEPNASPEPNPSREPAQTTDASEPSPDPAQTAPGQTAPTATPNRFGNGLKNIMRRMHEIGGYVQLEKSQGLRVRLESPLPEKA